MDCGDGVCLTSCSEPLKERTQDDGQDRDNGNARDKFPGIGTFFKAGPTQGFDDLNCGNQDQQKSQYLGQGRAPDRTLMYPL